VLFQEVVILHGELSSGATPLNIDWWASGG
jgi:hypothetical protein